MISWNKVIQYGFSMCLSLQNVTVSAQSISNYLYGQNAWMPSVVPGGEFEEVIDKLEAEGDEPFKIIRIGGTRFDDSPLTNAQYLSLIEDIRSIGAEPLIQVPISESVAYAADLVDYFNVDQDLDVRFWSIGNEPDLGWLDETVDGRTTNSADDVAYYFKNRASAMKAVDSSIKIFGPDFSFYVDEEDNPDWHPMDTWHYPLLENNYYGLWGKDANGNYYIDYYAFHVYQYVTPSNVERKLSTILSHIATINSSYRDAGNQLGWAITETHITTNNDNVSEHDKTWSFYAGQHIAQIFGLGMKYKAFCINPWSIHESSGLRDGEGAYANGAYDLGFFDEGPDYKPRSTYYHELMLSKKAKKNYLWGYTNNSKLYQVATKDETGFAIMIMNDNATAGGYTLRLNYEDQTDTYEIYVDANIAKQYESEIGAYETQMVFLDESGEYIGHITYSSSDEASGNPPTYSGITPDRVALNTWSNGEWKDFYPPGATQDALINSDYSLLADGNFESNNLTIASGATLTIETGETLLVNGLLENEGNIVVASGGSLITLGEVSGTGFAISRNTTFSTFIDRYSVIGSPVTDASTSMLGTLVYSYDERVAYGSDGSQRFSKVTSPESMSAGDAYFSSATGSVTFSGTPNTGQVDVMMVYNPGVDGSNAGFNLVSNPYPAAISYAEFVALNATSNSVIGGAIYLWDDGGSDAGQRTNSDYITVNSLGSASAGSSRSSDWNGHIGSAQGFFVKAIAAGTLSFTDEMKVSGSNEDASFFRSSHTQSPSTIKLTLTNELTGVSVETLVGLAADATSGTDLLYDAEVIGGLNGVRFYSLINDQPYTIQGLPLEEQVVPLGMELSGEGQTFSISLASLTNWPANLEVNLWDANEEQLIALQNVSAYQFETDMGKVNERFQLRLEGSSILGLEEIPVEVQANPDIIRIHGTTDRFNLVISDLSGRCLLDREIQPLSPETNIPVQLRAGMIYVISLRSKSFSTSQKILFK